VHQCAVESDGLLNYIAWAKGREGVEGVVVNEEP